MKKIKLTGLGGEYTALIDDEDYPLVSTWKWKAMRARKTGRVYAGRTKKTKGRSGHQAMHRLIMGNPVGFFVDHVQIEATLDNRKNNLRLATASQNQHNRGVQRTNTSGWKGVSWHSRARKWAAFITAKSKTRYVGIFKTPENAAIAYNIAALELHGTFAFLNKA